MKTVLVVSSDAGGTNALVPVVRELLRREVRVHVVASGPAVKIWQWEKVRCNYNKVKDSINETDAVRIIEKYQTNVIVTGAGAYNNIEHTFRRVAFKAGIFCFALMDSWGNYRCRFRRKLNGSVTHSLPDLIGVMDELCYKDMVAEGFDPEKCIIVGAPHLEEVVTNVASASESDIECWRAKYKLSKNVRTFVFFSETIAFPDSNDIIDYFENGNLPPWGFTQTTILLEVIKVISNICIQHNVQAQLIIKPHPMESTPFLNIIRTINTSPLLDCRIISDCDLQNLVCLADAILGITSTALLGAALAGKPVFSIQIGKNYLKYPDFSYGNRIGIMTKIHTSEGLQRALQEIFFEKQNQVKTCNTINFNGSTNKVVDTILAYGDLNKNNSFTKAKKRNHARDTIRNRVDKQTN